MSRKNFNNEFSYDKADKKNKNFMCNNFSRSKSYNTDFSASRFQCVSFRGAHLKKCNFYRCNFSQAEFIGSNLKGSRFKEAKFDNTIFEGAVLSDADFGNAKFTNTFFVGCDVTQCKNLNLNHPEIRFFESMPELNISSELESAVLTALENEHVKASRVLDTKDGRINPLSMLILSEKFDERALIEGMNFLKFDTDKDFYTLSYIIKQFQSLTF